MDQNSCLKSKYSFLRTRCLSCLRSFKTQLKSNGFTYMTPMLQHIEQCHFRQKNDSYYDPQRNKINESKSKFSKVFIKYYQPHFSKAENENVFIKCFCKQQFDLRRDQRNFIELKPFLTHIDNYHRNVFQYPGNIHGPKSVGCEKSATKPRENVLKIKTFL